MNLLAQGRYKKAYMVYLEALINNMAENMENMGCREIYYNIEP